MNIIILVILIILLVFAVYVPHLVTKTYRLGLSDCSKLLKNEEIITKKIKVEAREPTKDEIIAGNIENYSGDGKGQIRLEEDS